jgi:hypothetical protein
MKQFFVWARFEKTDILRTKNRITLTESVTIIDQRPSWEANSKSGSQETAHLSWNSQTDNVFTRDCTYPTLSQMTSILSHIISFTIHHNIIILFIYANASKLVCSLQVFWPQMCRHFWLPHAYYNICLSIRPIFDHPNKSSTHSRNNA